MPREETKNEPAVYAPENITPITKDEIAHAVTDPGENFVPQLKWSLDKSTANEHFDSEKTRNQILALTRGGLLERISKLVLLNQAEYPIPITNTALATFLKTVEITAPENLDSPTIGTPSGKVTEERNLQPGEAKGKKVGLLQGAVAATADNPLGLKGAAWEEYAGDIIEGYGSGTAGIYYQETTMPDGFITHEGLVCGVVEVKAYTSVEFHTYVTKAAAERNLQVFVSMKEIDGGQTKHYGDGMHLGLDIAGEQRMADILADAQYAHRTGNIDPANDVNFPEPLGREVPIILRVLEDVAEEDIISLTNLAQELGYPNFFVQKLPFSEADLNQLARETLRGKKVQIMGGDKFSMREKRVIARILETE